MIRQPKVEDLKLTLAINRVLDEMDVYGPDTPEYQQLITHLAALIELQDTKKSKRRVSPDTLAIVAGNLFGIVIIVSFEHTHALVSKATGFILKTK